MEKRYHGQAAKEPALHAKLHRRLTAIAAWPLAELAMGLLVLCEIGFVAAECLWLVTNEAGDGACYVAMAQWLHDGGPLSFAGFHSLNEALPAGYPLLIAGMAHLGLATPVGLKLLNFAGLAVGIGACWIVLRKSCELGRRSSACILLFFAGSVTVIELASTVAAEAAFFAASMVALACLSQRTWGWRGIVAALAAAGAAISLRTVGIALLPAIGLASIEAAAVGRRPNYRRLVLWSLPLLPLAVWGGVLLTRTHYFSEGIVAGYTPGGGGVSAVVSKQIYKLTAFGELAANLRIEDYYHIYRADFVLAGLAVLLLVGVGMWSRRRLAPVDVYFLCYTAIIFAWPFWTFAVGRRFWAPVLPLIAAYVALGLVVIGKRIKLSPRRGAQLVTAGVVLSLGMGCFQVTRDALANRHNRAAAQALAHLQEKP